ncbi:Selenocysteine-specific translation elongation factor [hydrothermal vent metagenome]|uniref:Selenocysteine-specific elongation factor n=1 Tax=hydrothermal vent metagenome TaxID=652676 RepID=A0A3B1D3D0_9ZZZZ
MRLINSIIGTAGHIDHGKTALVKALTGEDCDRLEEEKKRGITIDIGFARLNLEDGQVVGVVDAPGHLSFIHNMLAGTSGIDIAMLVVAADDSVMPQTVEHLAILELMGVCRGVVALTKCDLVDRETLELAKEDVARLIKHSSLSGATIIPCSSATGEGIDTLKKELASLAHQTKKSSGQKYFRMPVDRVFSVKGYGAVVTGSVMCGEIKVDERVAIIPGGGDARVRGIQNHGETAPASAAGNRTALNLAGVGRESVRRGRVVCHRAIANGFRSFVAQVICHKSSPHNIAHAKSYMLHIHTAETLCRVYLESETGIKPGERCFAQIRFEEPVQINYGDRFVIRTSSAKHTLGGGLALFPGGPLLWRRGIKRGKGKWTALLNSEREGALSIVAERPWGVLVDEIVSLFNLRQQGIRSLLKEMEGVGTFEYKGDEYIYVKEEGERILQNIENAITRFHKENGAATGIEESRLMKTFALENMEERLAGYWIRRAISSGKALYNGSFIQLPGRKARFSQEDEAIKNKIILAYKEGGLTPPKIATLHRDLELPKSAAATIVRALIASGDLVPITPDYALYKDVFREAKEKLLREVRRSGSVDTATYRDLMGIGRKAAIEILEYLDKTGVTKRVDNKGTRKLK